MDSLAKAWRDQPPDTRRRIARAVNRGERLKTAREATLAVWYAAAQTRNQPRTAALNFAVLVVVFASLRILLDDRSPADALADPQVYVVAAVGAAVQLLVHWRVVRPKLRAGIAANAALLEGRARKGPIKPEDAARLRALVEQDGWLQRRWRKHG